LCLFFDELGVNNQRNCFLSSAAKNLRYFTKNKPSFCQNKKGVGVGLVVSRDLRLKGLILATNKYRGKWSRSSVGG
jgi:hypothetical protein